MIAYLKGMVAGTDAGSLVLDVGGVGYQLLMSSKALGALPPSGSPAMVWVHLQVKDDGITLYGFKDLAEKTMFLRLVGVSGIGPKMAIAALSTYSASELSQLIAEGDVAALSRVPGIGKKTAQRAVLELQGILRQDEQASASAPAAGSALADASTALQSMGFSADEVAAVFKGVDVAGKDAGALLRAGLKALGGAR
ncbi:MAG: Holliday junction branch migration protein RuvA [Coriobacteriales bacterium]